MYTLIVANAIRDIGQIVLAAGTLNIQATDDHNTPVDFMLPGQGQFTSDVIEVPIVDGAITDTISVPDSALTVPANVKYHFWITNQRGRKLLEYWKVFVTGNVFDLGTYSPPTAGLTPPPVASTIDALTVNNLSVPTSLVIPPTFTLPYSKLSSVPLAFPPFPHGQTSHDGTVASSGVNADITALTSLRTGSTSVLAVSAANGAGLWFGTGPTVTVTHGGVDRLLIGSGGDAAIGSGSSYRWSSVAGAGGSGDTNLSRIAAGVVGVGTGGNGSTAGELRATNVVTSGSNGWGATTAAADTFVWRDAANVLAQRNGANAQTFRLYNTYTDAANYERLSIAWVAGVATIVTEWAGTGVAHSIRLNAGNNVYLTTNSVDRFLVNTNGQFLPVTDATNDLGAAATRLRTLYLTGSISHEAATVATSGANVNSPLHLFKSSYWDGSTNQVDTWQQGVFLSAGANPTSTLVISHSGSSGTAQINVGSTAGGLNTNCTVYGNITALSPVVATSGANSNSTVIALQPRYWDGAASQVDTWSIQAQVGAGANPTSTLNIGHGGSPGAAAVNVVPNLQLVGKVTKYNNVNTAGVGMAAIVAVVQLAAQTAALGPVTVLTPTAAGVYRVSIASYTSTAGTAGTLDVQVAASNGQFAQTFGYTTFAAYAPGVMSLTGNSYRTNTVIIHVGANQPITYTTVMAGATGSPAYNLDIIVEQLA